MNRMRQITMLGVASLLALHPVRFAQADPCGMVPPMWTGTGSPIQRIGDQMTYVFYKDGIETFVIRPGFHGKVDEFGMLIPFPSPPSIRKVQDDIFSHIQAAIDPPEVVVDLSPRPRTVCESAVEDSAAPMLRFQKGVAVLKEEAVGMYEVAVLKAGSAQALQRWMDQHGYRYPEGMDVPCQDYVEKGWCFVAVKTRVGSKPAVDARPGMRGLDPSLPQGASFDGYVQAMGFRFRTEELVVPMRLSAFNGGDLHNIVYVLTDGPRKIRDLPESLVVRQIEGEELFRNVTQPLPLRIIGGTKSDLNDWHREWLPQERDPAPHNRYAKELFAADLLAIMHDRLAHPHEDQEKRLLDISERLDLRGPQIDLMIEDVLENERRAMIDLALENLHGMTLTVLDGNLPREHIAERNLEFDAYAMKASLNLPKVHDARERGPAKQGGVGVGGTELDPYVFLAILGSAFVLLLVSRRLRSGSALGLLLVAGIVATGSLAEASDSIPVDDPSELLELAVNGSTLYERGQAIVALSHGHSPDVSERLLALAKDQEQPALIRNWALAACIRLCSSADQVFELTPFATMFPALNRPFSQKWPSVLDPTEPEPWLSKALELAATHGGLTQGLMPVLQRVPVEALVGSMTSAPNDNARRLAASFLATKAQSDPGVALAIVAAYSFDGNQDCVPWEGGALFVPGLAWKKEEARSLVRALLAWMVWCAPHSPDSKQWTPHQQQIHNNLRSLQLAAAAGYQSPGWLDGITLRWWLKESARAFGSGFVQAILEEQGLDNSTLYRSPR